jgi:hypothetical protein
MGAWIPHGVAYPSGLQERAAPPHDSGWEGKTDWYRNIEHEPALEVRTGRVAYRPVQEFLSPEETAQLILALFRQHPREVR